MTGPKIFAVDVLDAGYLLKAKTLGADTIICNEEAGGIDHSAFRMINAEVYRIQGTWEAYSYNTNVAKRLVSRYRNKLKINAARIDKAIPKLLYWTNHHMGYLHACINHQGWNNYEVKYIQPYFSGRRLREIVKYFYYFFKNNAKWLKEKRHTNATKPINQCQIGILINDEFELGVFEYLIRSLPKEKLVIFYNANINFGKYTFIDESMKKMDLRKVRKYSRQYLMNPFMAIEELNAFNIIARDWQLISTCIEQYKYIGQSGVSSLLINVGENQPLINLLPEILGDKIKVFNTMNGIKSGEAHDADVNFTKWFVWDEQMKKLLVENCGVNGSMLAVTGHMMQDFVNHYQFRNTANVDLEKLKDRKVISVFSVRGRREEKIELLNYLYDLLKQDSSYFLIIRPHPAETEEDMIFPPMGMDNIHFASYNQDNSKQSLYDQIFLSDIGIVFGSTVAIECKWMNVPVVTFEKREISNVYCADDKNIIHLRNLDNVKTIIKTLEKKGNQHRYHDNLSVATRMINEML